MAAQESGAHGVKGSSPQTRVIDARERSHALHHLSGGLVGERHQQDVLCCDALRQQPRDAIGQGAGLARAGSGDDQLGAIATGDGRVLLLVEIGLEVDLRPMTRAARQDEAAGHQSSFTDCYRAAAGTAWSDSAHT